MIGPGSEKYYCQALQSCQLSPACRLSRLKWKTPFRKEQLPSFIKLRLHLYQEDQPDLSANSRGAPLHVGWSWTLSSRVKIWIWGPWLPVDPRPRVSAQDVKWGPTAIFTGSLEATIEISLNSFQKMSQYYLCKSPRRRLDPNAALPQHHGSQGMLNNDISMRKQQKQVLSWYLQQPESHQSSFSNTNHPTREDNDRKKVL